ncbi:MAG: VOC family protein [Gammaproteobacteria bacterium]
MILGNDSKFGRLFHIGYVTRDIHRAIARVTADLGARQLDLLQDIRGASGEPSMLYAISHLAFAGAELELLQPRLEIESVYLQALPADADAIAMHHAGYLHPDVPSWEAAMADIRARGLPIAFEVAAPDLRCAYVDLRRQVGHYAEILWRARGSYAG